MADGKKTEDNSEQVAAVLRAQLKQMQLGLKEQIFRSVDMLKAQIIQNIRQNLTVRTGHLLNSIKGTVKQESGGWVGTVASQGVPYALIHEFGGVIKPKNAKNLVFPVEENRRRDGSAKTSLAEVFDNPRHFFYKDILWIPKDNGKGVQKGVLPMFYFKKSVTIPARPYIRPAIAAKQDQIMKDFGIFLNLSFKPKGE